MTGPWSLTMIRLNQSKLAKYNTAVLIKKSVSNLISDNWTIDIRHAINIVNIVLFSRPRHTSQWIVMWAERCFIAEKWSGQRMDIRNKLTDRPVRDDPAFLSSHSSSVGSERHKIKQFHWLSFKFKTSFSHQSFSSLRLQFRRGRRFERILYPIALNFPKHFYRINRMLVKG